MATIGPRFPGEWAMRPPPDAILTIGRGIGSTAWRARVLTPGTTVPRFLVQMLPGHRACSHPPLRSG